MFDARHLHLALVLVLPVLSGCGAPNPLAEPAEESRMVRLLRELSDQSPPNEFQNGTLRVREAAALPGASVAERALATEYAEAREALLAGHNEEAIRRFTDLNARLSETAVEISPTIRRRAQTFEALAHLRLGEQENCLENHNAASCLLPIRAEGVHQLQRGSRAALPVLASLLEQDADDLTALWLYNVAAMTLGTYPDEVPERWRIPLAAFDSEAVIEEAFPDLAHELGVATIDNAGGSVVEDFDRDGDLDILASSWGVTDPLRFYRNGGARGFAAEPAGLSGLTGGLNLVQADYDNDGFVDVLVLRGAWKGSRGEIPNSLLRNRGDGTFEDVTHDAGLLSLHPTQTAAWADVDGDGWLDLFVGNESGIESPHPSELFMSRGDGTFEEVAEIAGIAYLGFVKGVAWGDYDNDGRPDLFVSRLGEPNLLIHHEGIGPDGVPEFRDVTAEAGVAEPIASFPTWFFDYDNDGWLDLFVSGYLEDSERVIDAVAADYLGRPADGERPRLYRNRGDGTFEDRTAEAGLDRVLYAMGANFGDLDNDGFPDFLLATGAPDYAAIMPNRMFLNDRRGGFLDVTTAGGFGHLQKGHGVSFGDLDNDGDQEIYVVMGGKFTGDVYSNSLYLNPGGSHHWLTLELAGVEANRSAIGARIEVKVDSPDGTRSLFHTVGSGGSFGANSLQAEIGLGTASRVRELEVIWPGSGRRQTWSDIVIDRAYRVVEGEEALQHLERTPIDLRQAAEAAGDDRSSGHATHEP